MNILFEIFYKTKYYLIIFFLFLVYNTLGQGLSGKVIDKDNGERLAFVNIIYNSKNQGLASDIEGNFYIDDKSKIEFLKISYLGYKTQIIELNELKNKNKITIELEIDGLLLNEIEILPGENPAHRIINLVIENRDRNNPEKIKNFCYHSYNKMHFTIDNSKQKLRKQKQDSIKNITSNNNDTLITNDSVLVLDTLNSNDNKIDTTKKTGFSMSEFLSRQHIFLTEVVTERKYRYPNNNKEQVLAQRMSGMKNPAFLLLTSQFQSMSFYKDYIEILNKKYLSPFSKNSVRQFYFEIEDTMYNEKGDSIFIISYRPYKGKKFDGVKGIMHINSNLYAVESISAEPAEKHPFFDVSIQQKFEFIKDTQWFPVQLNTNIIFNTFQVADDSLQAPLIGIGKCYIYDIELDTNFKKREFNQIEVEIKNDATKKDEDFWNKYRYEDLTAQDIETYKVIDSIGEEMKLDRIMDGIEILTNGAIPFLFLNIDLDKIYWYDEYQGHRLGLGLSTNQRLSKYFSLNGYFGYSFAVKSWSYGAGIDFTPMPFHKSNLSLSFNYSNDFETSDNYNFYSANKFSLTNEIMGMWQKELDSAKTFRPAISFTMLKFLNLKLAYTYSERQITNPDRYLFDGDIPEKIFLNEIALYLRYAYKERFLQTPRGYKLSLGTKFPILYLNVIKGLKVLKSENSYWKIETSISKTFIIRNFGETTLFATASSVLGNPNYSNLYMITGVKSWLNFNNVFNTMGVNEFVCERYASLFLYHNFKSLIIKTPKFAPEIVIVTAAAWGDAKNVKESNDNNYAKLMNKGYFESGLQINYLLSYKKFFGLGLAVYYRYGAYHYDKEIKNWAFKLTASIDIN